MSTATWVTVPSTMLKQSHPVVDGPYSADRSDTDSRFPVAAPATVAGPETRAAALSVATAIERFDDIAVTPSGDTG
jgi:hypothetical protein